MKELYDIVFGLLEGAYGRPEWRQHLPPVDELVSTILSQNTSDINRDRAFSALKTRYPDWEAVMNAPESDIRETIRSAGLANQKAPRIQNALREIQEERGELELDFLDDMRLDDARQWLVSIKGVGPKTAAIVLLFAFGRPAFPVDTHVHRVTRRLGLIEPQVTAEKAHQILENMGDPDTFYSFHLNLIRHGRQVCTARNPRCDACLLKDYCFYFQNGRKLA
jgi:endonuclease-3